MKTNEKQLVTLTSIARKAEDRCVAINEKTYDSDKMEFECAIKPGEEASTEGIRKSGWKHYRINSEGSPTLLYN